MPTRAPALAATGGPTTDASAEARVLKRFRQIYTAARNHLSPTEKQLGLSGATLWALGIVGAQPGIGVTALAREMQLHQSTTSNLLRSLVERELVATSRHESDGRALRLNVSAKGAEMLARVRGPVTSLLSQALAQLDDATLLRMEADLNQLIRNMGVHDDAPANPISGST